jgi:hypothetical protein
MNELTARKVEQLWKSFNLKRNSFYLFAKNCWSAIQITDNLLMTIRFAYKENEVPPNPVNASKLGEIVVKGEVIEDWGTNFIPREFLLQDELNKIYKIVTYFWAFQGVPKIGDVVKVWGTLLENESIIVVDNLSHGIQKL